MGLGFLGGLGMIAPSVQSGYDAGVERQRQAEERQRQAEDRAFQLTQRQRTIDEQKREDQYREGMQGVQTTEEIDDPNFVPTPPAQTAVAQVSINDDGSETVTPAQAPQVAPKITRQRNKDDVLMDYAAMARKAGKLDQAFKFEADAEKASHDRAAALFQQWSASTPDTGDVVAAANQAKQIYNNDRLPGRVENVQPDGKGGVVLTMFNKMSGQTMQLPIKNIEELKTKLEGYYSPETYTAYIKAKREAYIRAQEKNAEPRVVNPGGVLIAGGKEVYKNTTDRVQIGVDDNNNPIWAKPGGSGRSSGTGTGSGGGKAPKEFIDRATELLDKNMPKADSPEASEQRSTAIQNLTRLYDINPNMRPETAQFIARDAAMNPARMTLQLNNATGDFSSFYSNPNIERGRKFEIGVGAGSLDEAIKVHGEGKVSGAVNNMLNGLAANQPADKRAAWIDATKKAASDPKMVEAIVAQAAADGKDPEVVRRQLDLIGRFNAPQQKAAGDAPVYTDAQKEAARKFGYDPDAPGLGARMAQGARGMFKAIGSAAAPSDSFVRSALQKINITGRIDQGDAVAIASAIENKPELKGMFTPEQLDAVRVISGRKF